MKDALKVVVFGGLCVLPLLPMYVAHDLFFPFITGKNFAFRIVAEIMFGAWVLLALIDARYRPRYSLLLASFGAFLAVMFVANVFGEYPLKSFWSNFERMDGYVTLVHVFATFLVVGSIMHERQWWRWLFTFSTVIALGVALVGLAQLSTDGGRVDSRLGNAAYMAVYMLFHIFFALYVATRSRVLVWRGVWLLVAALLTYTLLQTGTRGTFLGLVGGITVSVGYLALFGRAYPQLRRVAVGGLLVLILAAVSFVALRDSALLPQTGPVARIAQIDIANDLTTRSTIWSIALEGVKERPLLGWGQGNFNYVFNTYYEPSLYDQEQWFDRVHNIVLDWLIAGGVLGLAAYVSIFVALAYYLVWVPYRRPDNVSFDVVERALLTGLIAGYVIHNLVIFDNLISYLFFAIVLALVHARVAAPLPPYMQAWSLPESAWKQVAVPVVVVVTGCVVYFCNASGILAARDIIDAYRAEDPLVRLEAFQAAQSRDSFAQQEIMEQLALQAAAAVLAPTTPPTVREDFIATADASIQAMLSQKPNDARLHLMAATFYRQVGNLEAAQEQVARARELSPNKPTIILEEAGLAMQLGQIEEGMRLFEEAFALEERNEVARVLYAAAAAAIGDLELTNTLITDEYFSAFASNNFALNAVQRAGDFELLVRMLRERITRTPAAPQNYASLAFVEYRQGNVSEAIAVLKEAQVAVPVAAAQLGCFIDVLESGGNPETATCN